MIALHFLFGQLLGGLRDGHLQIALLCFLYPFFHAGLLLRLQPERLTQRAQFARHGIGQLLQRALADFQVALRDNFLGTHQVVARLRFVRVGDGGGAHFEITLGLLQLLCNGGLLRPCKLYAILCYQHVEIGLRHAHD